MLKKRKQDLRRKITKKTVLCNRCSLNTLEVDSEAEGGTCSSCVQRMVGPPEILIKKKQEGPKKPKGWHWYKVFVDSDGNVFHKGKEKPELKGTLAPTKIKQKKQKKQRKKETIREKNKRLLKEQEKLAKQYKKRKLKRKK